MKKVVSRINLAIVLIFTLGCGGEVYRVEKESELQKLDWLLGTWQRESKDQVLYETWRRVSNHTLEGDSYAVADRDTVFTEFLRIEQFGDSIFYPAKISDNEYSVPFKLVSLAGSSVVFENPNHDFPQRISYSLMSDGSPHARAEGLSNGEESGLDFRFTKVY